MKKLKLVLPFLAFLFLQNIQAQDEEITHTFHSEAFGKDRNIYVYLPDRYFEDTTAQFSVAYILDGHYPPFWNLAKYNIGYLVQNYQSIPMIAVGIHSDNRGEEFTPPAAELTKHLKEEVFPILEENYRITKHRTLIGHSWAGALVTSTLFSENADMFDAYLNISPSIGYDDGVIFKKADSLLQNKKNFRKYLYASTGTVGRREFEFGSYVNQLDSLINKYPNETLAWKSTKFEGTDHWSCVIPSFNDGLISMSRNYFCDQKIMEDFARNKDQDLMQQIEEFYTRQESIFGFTHQPEFNYLRFVAGDFEDLENFKAALALYQWSLKLRPNYIKALIGVANIHMKTKNYEAAKPALDNLKNALEAQKEDFSEDWLEGVEEWIEEKMEEID